MAPGFACIREVVRSRRGVWWGRGEDRISRASGWKMDSWQKPRGNLLTLEVHLGEKTLEERSWHQWELKQGHRQETKGQLKTLATKGEVRAGEESGISRRSR